MQFRKILLRVMLWSLAIAAVVGALAILVAAREIVWRVVGTALTTAVASALLLALSLLFEREKSRSAALFGMAAVLVEFLLTLVLIWDFVGLFVDDYHYESAIAITIGFIFLTGVPAMFFLRTLHMPQARIAAQVGLILSAIVFLLAMVAAWGPRRIWHNNAIWDSIGTTSAFGIVAVVCLVGVGTDRRHWRYLGIAASALGLAIALWAIWNNIRQESAIFTTICSIAGVIAYANVAMICPLMPNQQWVRWIALGAAILTAAFIDFDATFPHGSNSELLLRSAGATGFIAACATLAMLVLARLNQGLGQQLVLAEIRQLTLICPGCHKKQLLPVGDAQCPTCHLRFSIKIAEPRCPNCDYLLYMLKSDRCPECGTPLPTPALPPHENIFPEP
ncbi:MAG TPA: hypothetical protein VHP11_02945 [Tepidisphaeraceae bacterium]|nr:hypothetical protein [Tepidisphaeraceae bacterium]